MDALRNRLDRGRLASQPNPSAINRRRLQQRLSIAVRQGRGRCVPTGGSGRPRSRVSCCRKASGAAALLPSQWGPSPSWASRSGFQVAAAVGWGGSWRLLRCCRPWASQSSTAASAGWRCSSASVHCPVFSSTATRMPPSGQGLCSRKRKPRGGVASPSPPPAGCPPVHKAPLALQEGVGGVGHSGCRPQQQKAGLPV